MAASGRLIDYPVWMLIVTTGSRTWPADQNKVIHQALETCMSAAFAKNEILDVRVGDARGADKVIYLWADIAHRRGWAVGKPQKYAAQWRGECVPGRCKPGHRYSPDNRGEICPMAGYFRNELMVQEYPVPEFCLAFIHDDGRGPSRGATHCATFATEQGVDVTTFRL